MEREKQKLAELDGALAEELRRAKEGERTRVGEFERVEEQKTTMAREIAEQEERRHELGGHLDGLIRENEMLKGELKRFGELTSEKVLELENGINNVARMREYEKENSSMEREKVQNHCEFVLEQIRAQA